MGISPLTGQTYGSTNAQYFLRPQHTVNIDANRFWTMGSQRHNFKFGMGWRRTDAYARTIYPGNNIVAYQNSATNFRARVYREGAGTNRSLYLDFYVADTISVGRATFDLGLRYDRQWGYALGSSTQANAVFPSLVPGIDFTGYDAPFHWNNLTPRVGVTFALDEERKTILRASFSRNAGQLSHQRRHRTRQPQLERGMGRVSVDRPQQRSSGSDERGEHGRRILASGNGFNTANPTSVSLRQPDRPGLRGARRHRRRHRLRPGAHAQPGRAGELHVRPCDRKSVHAVHRVDGGRLAPGAPLVGTLPDGSAFNIPTYIPDADKVAAVGGGRLLTNWPDYYTYFNGMEFAVNKRMSDRWMMRLGAAFNNPTEALRPEPAGHR